MRMIIKLIAVITLFIAFNTNKVQAETFPVINNPTVIQECGECHMAYPPETLSKQSWENIMSSLPNHFGEDASLNASTGNEILGFYVSNSFDMSNTRAAQKWRTNSIVEKITEAPRFIKKHRGCPQEVWAHKNVSSKANCLACHKTMDKNGSTHADLSFLPSYVQRQCDND